MAAITWDDVVVFAAELSDVPLDAQDMILGYVNNRHDGSIFGGETSWELKLLRVMLAAHIASSASTTDARDTAGSGLVTEETIGKMSRSYTFTGIEAGASDAGLQTTGYGRQYRTMVRGSAARVGFAF